ncbi:hypothetical protein ZWY2020_004387 [Hordeum vulgare]|nr:hypothetical protein ZWY2020_004387 [Hordeum vulgare]
MPPHRRQFLKSEGRLQPLEQTRIRRAAGLTPDAVDPKEEEPTEDVRDVGDAHLWAEQQSILDFIPLGVGCRGKTPSSAGYGGGAGHGEAKLLAYMEAVEEESDPSYAPVYLAPNSYVVDISDDDS